MTSFYYDSESAEENYPCTVKINEQEILVEYRDKDNALVQYRGENLGSGHFELHATSINARATLHMFPDARFLEGSWIEDGTRGMWRVELA